MRRGGGAVAAVLVMLSAGRVNAAISIVQSAVTSATVSNQTSVTTSLSGVTAGNLLVAIVSTDGSAMITAPASWLFATRGDMPNAGIAIYYYPSYPSTSVSATFSFASGGKGAGIVELVELAGATSSPLDASGTAAGTGNMASVTASAATANGELAMVAFAEGSQTKDFGTSPSPFANIGAGDAQSTTTAARATYDTVSVATGATVSESLPISQSAQWAAVAVTFKPAALYWICSGTGASAHAFTDMTCWAKSSGGTSASVVPGASDVVTFDGNGTGDCNLSSSATTQVDTIATTTGYTGTITQAAQSVSLGGSLSVGAGTFKGASGQTITATGSLAVSGGVFNGNGATVSVSALAISGGTFTEGAGNFTTSGAATFSGGTSTFSAGTSAFHTSLTMSGASTSLTFGAGAPTVTGAATLGGTGTATFGAGQLTLGGGLDVEGATVTLGSSAATATVTGAVTLGSGSLNLTNGSASPDFTNTTLFTQSGGTLNVNGASATIGTTITNAGNDAFTQSAGTFNNTTAGGSVSFGMNGGVGNGQGGAMDQSGTSAVYNSVSTATETFNGPIIVSGAVTVGAATLNGSNSNRTAVTINAGATMSLSTSFAFSSGSAMTLAGTLNAAGTVSFAGPVTLSGTFNAGSAATTFADVVTMSTGSAFNGGTGTTTFSLAPTLTAGTFTVAGAGSTGAVVFTAGATFASGMTLPWSPRATVNWPSSMARMSPTRRAARPDAGLRASAVAVWLTAACAGLSCGSPASSSGRPVTTQFIVAAAGGQASTSTGTFRVQVPPGALKVDGAITIQQVDPPAPGALGPVYDVGPTGTLFQRPVTLSFSFAGLSLAGVDPTTLHVATLSGGKWVPVTSAVDRASSVVTGQITHLSPWTLIVYTDVVPPEPDASTGDDVDAGANAPSGEGGSSGAGGGSAGTDGGARDASGAAGSGGAGARRAAAGREPAARRARAMAVRAPAVARRAAAGRAARRAAPAKVARGTGGAAGQGVDAAPDSDTPGGDDAGAADADDAGSSFA